MCKICQNSFDFEVLDISNCYKIETIPELINTKILTLNGNKNITELPESAELQILRLYFLKNPITIPDYKNLIEIKIINVNISQLPNNLNNIVTLFLQNTNITNLPVMDKIKYLTINTTPISIIPDLLNLEKLVLFKTKVKSLNSNLINLKSLNISKNWDIVKIPESYTCLEVLYITMSLISSLPKQLISLKKLYAHKSQLNYLHKEFVLMEEIDISDTKVKLIPKEYINIKSITYDKEKTLWDSSWYIEPEEHYKIIKLQKFIRYWNNNNLFDSDNILLLIEEKKNLFKYYSFELTDLYTHILKIKKSKIYYIFKSSIDIKNYLKSNQIEIKYKNIYSTSKILFTVLFDSKMVFINRTLNNIIRKAIDIKNIELSKQYINNVIKFDCIN